ncbi:MAG: hypothetical protein RR348_01245, partial [Clostridia bacterium]
LLKVKSEVSMKMKEVVEIALTYLGDEDASVSAQTAQHPKNKLLVKCVNLLLKEIACDYAPLVESEVVEVKDGKFCYDVFPHRVREIVKVVNLENGVDMKFEQKPLWCCVALAKKVEVCYAYVPGDIGVDDECVMSPKISSKTLALGAISEFCLIEGMYEQSALYGDKFREEMKNACRKNSEIKIKTRVWM